MMKKSGIIAAGIRTLSLLFFAFNGLLMETGFANYNVISALENVIEAPKLVLTSHSFNAKKRSSFTIAGKKEYVKRGLTVIHFNTSRDFEYKTFDTHESEVETKQFIAVLTSLRKDNAVFAILAHDSAAKSLLKQSVILAKMGFAQLSALKSRQAYTMHNFGGSIVEQFDDIGSSIGITIPKGINDKQVYFPKVVYEFKPSNDRYIAHAGGEVDGHKSTNTKAALDQNYKKGFRLFELDIIETSDGKLVAAHDWNMWSRFTEYKGSLPPTLEVFNAHNIYGDYETLDMEDINTWFAEHPDAILVTDKVNDPIAFADAFVDKNRLIMELFSVMAVEKASQQGINAMISHKAFYGIKGDKLNFLSVNNVKYVAVSRRSIAKNKDLMLRLKEQGVKVYVYHVNFDEGKDEKYVQENEIGIIYGMYADKWVFDEHLGKLSK